MRIVLWFALVTACDSGPPRAKDTVVSPVPASPDAATPIPRGPYVVKHGCSHSNEPFGRGGDVRETTVDLATKTETRLEYVYGDTSLPAAPGTPSGPPPRTVKTLDAARIATIESALDKVLRGGPFTNVRATPEGISCSLEVTAAGKLVIVVARSPDGAPITDAVTELINAL